MKAWCRECDWTFTPNRKWPSIKQRNIMRREAMVHNEEAKHDVDYDDRLSEHKAIEPAPIPVGTQASLGI